MRYYEPEDFKRKPKKIEPIDSEFSRTIKCKNWDCRRRITLQTAYFYFGYCRRCFKKLKKCDWCGKNISLKKSFRYENKCKQCHREYIKKITKEKYLKMKLQENIK